ncbi:hypothetical protein JCGZ_13115 [Jatropha curcas]|uniref:S1 motif domain-containing protein n=1 Tax=Jatropha curcas TaxID=180498 RepID=A0A067KJX4_JATCU|nr:30S ribosomal protein S1 [Jatropha curcas]KDP32565.1 hypothetical protein JCGZ_13115 [Jatropha curcas]
MTIFTASPIHTSFVSQLFTSNSNHASAPSTHFNFNFNPYKILHNSRFSFLTPKFSISANSNDSATVTDTTTPVVVASPDAVGQSRRSADWEAARAYIESGSIYEGRIEGFNGGGLLVRFYSILGFLPFPQLSPSHSCKEPHKTIHEIAKGLHGSRISVKVILAEEEKRNLIFSEKEAVWSKFSKRVNIGDTFKGRVGSVEDYGAFVHLLFPDGLYHLTGLVHVSEVSWDLVQDARDVLSEGDEVVVKVTNIDWQKSRIKLSIKQLEEDPLLETLDKVIPQDGSVDPDPSTMDSSDTVEPLPGLETIIQELLNEDGVEAVKISRQGFEKRVVSQDLQLWLSNGPPTNGKFTLLARAGRQVQEIQLTTALEQEGIKKALQRVLERVP